MPKPTIKGTQKKSATKEPSSLKPSKKPQVKNRFAESTAFALDGFDSGVVEAAIKRFKDKVV